MGPLCSESWTAVRPRRGRRLGAENPTTMPHRTGFFRHSPASRLDSWRVYNIIYYGVHVLCILPTTDLVTPRRQWRRGSGVGSGTAVPGVYNANVLVNHTSLQRAHNECGGWGRGLSVGWNIRVVFSPPKRAYKSLWPILIYSVVCVSAQIGIYVYNISHRPSSLLVGST